MGVLPLQFADGQSHESLGLDGSETFDIQGISDSLAPGSRFKVTATSADGARVKTFDAICRLDTPAEVDYYVHGGILQYVLRNLLTKK